MSWSFSSGEQTGPVSLHELEQLLGSRLIEWITGTSDWRSSTDDPVATVVAQLQEVASRSWRSFSTETLFHLEQELLRIGPFGNPLFLDLFATANSNEVIQAPADPVAEVCFTAALSILPRTLMPPELLTVGASSSSIGFDLAGKILADPDVMAMFGRHIDDDNGSVYRIQTQAHWSNGSATLQIGSFIMAMAEYAIDRSIILDYLSIATISNMATKAADDFRALARGKKISVPLTTSLIGVELQAPIRLQKATIFPGSSLAKHLRGVQPSASAVAVFETDFWLNSASPNELTDDFFTVAEEFQKANKRSHALIEEQLLRLRLSLLFASDSTKLIAPYPAASQLSTPVQSQPRFHIPLRSWGSGSYSQVDASAYRWRSHDFTARSRRLPKDLYMGVRRILSAAAEREDANDGFVDAIIAWEAMVGGDTAVSFRVCAALALLLDAEEGTVGGSSFEELQQLYAMRSKVVHGSGVLGTEALQKRDRAIEVALKSLRVIMRSPELLARSDAAARNKALLLGRVSLVAHRPSATLSPFPDVASVPAE